MSTQLKAPTNRLAALRRAHDEAERRLYAELRSAVPSGLPEEHAASTFAARIILRDLERLDAEIARAS